MRELRLRSDLAVQPVGNGEIHDLICLEEHMRTTTLCAFGLALGITAAAAAPQSIPDKLVVLTFDDSKASHYTVVRPRLKKYGFGATFFITEGFTFRTNKDDYLTWEQIAELHRDG